MRKTILTSAALLAGLLTSSATVTVQGWWHLDSAQPINDSSGNSRTFGSAYSTAPAAGGRFAALPINNGAGGPLGKTGYTSTQCIQVGVGVGGKRQSAMWGIGYNPPVGAYGIEIWVLPQGNGIAGGSGGWIFFPVNLAGWRCASITRAATPILTGHNISTLSCWALALPLATRRNGYEQLDAPGDRGQRGCDHVLYKWRALWRQPHRRWNVSRGRRRTSERPSDNQAYYGYLDEARMFTFAAGASRPTICCFGPPAPTSLRSPKTPWFGQVAPRLRGQRLL